MSGEGLRKSCVGVLMMPGEHQNSVLADEKHSDCHQTSASTNVGPAIWVLVCQETLKGAWVVRVQGTTYVSVVNAFIISECSVSR